MKIGRKIYYDIETGAKILEKSERQGSVRPTTIEQDIAVYTALSERNRETFDYLELDFGQYAQDFAECNRYRVDPYTKQIEFSYPDPNETEPSEPEYQLPLSEQVKLLQVQKQALSEQVDFHEELIVELAMQVYNV